MQLLKASKYGGVLLTNMAGVMRVRRLQIRETKAPPAHAAQRGGSATEEKWMSVAHGGGTTEGSRRLPSSPQATARLCAYLRLNITRNLIHLQVYNDCRDSF